MMIMSLLQNQQRPSAYSDLINMQMEALHLLLVGVTEVEVKSKEEMAMHLARGSSSRATESTNTNSQER